MFAHEGKNFWRWVEKIYEKQAGQECYRVIKVYKKRLNGKITIFFSGIN